MYTNNAFLTKGIFAWDTRQLMNILSGLLELLFTLNMADFSMDLHNKLFPQYNGE